jgi:hypothetical protein
MAAGHANEPLRRELITGILNRALAEPRRARRLKLLAVACLETLPSVPDDLRAAIERCLEDLIPPRNNAAARSLATAGEPVLARLPQSLEGLGEAAAAATVQTAWLINGPKALDILARYAADRRRNVQMELNRAWDYFDPDEYAERVLAAMPPGGHLYVLRSPAQLAALSKASSLEGLEASLLGPIDLNFFTAHAPSLRSLSLYYKEPGADLTALPELPKLRQLAVGVPGLADLGFLDALPQLESVWLPWCEDVEDYSPLLRFTALHTLALHGSRHLCSLGQLPPLGTVGSLALGGSRLGRGGLDLLVVAAPNVIYLYLDNCDWLDDLAPLTGLKLEDLRIYKSSSVSDLRPLSGQADLWLLDVSQTQVRDLTPLGGLTKLEILRLRGCNAVSDLRPLAGLPRLKELLIQGIAPGTDLSPLAQNQRVTVEIAAGQHVRGAEKLGRRLIIN